MQAKQRKQQSINKQPYGHIESSQNRRGFSILRSLLDDWGPSELLKRVGTLCKQKARNASTDAHSKLWLGIAADLEKMVEKEY